MVTFIIFAAILLMNLIIAVISSVYNILKEDSMGVYLDDIVRKRPVMVFDKYYSGLVSMPFPLNAFMIPFYPVYYFVKHENFNLTILITEYLIVLVFVYGLFMVVSFSLIPFAYLKISCSKLFLI
jgi:hypothetical protein